MLNEPLVCESIDGDGGEYLQAEYGEKGRAQKFC